MSDLPKSRDSTSFPPSFRDFLFKARLGTGTSYAHARSIFRVQMFILISSANQAAQNAAKQRMTNPQKSLSNNARSVVKSLPP